LKYSSVVTVMSVSTCMNLAKYLVDRCDASVQCYFVWSKF